MRRSTWQPNALVAFVAIIILLAALLNTRAVSAGAHRTGVDMNLTLSVYTCCGSLQGFTDTNPADLSSMYKIYGRLWAQMFPHLTWQETPFTDQATLEVQLTKVVNAGRPPDMVFIQGGDMGYIVLRNLAQPLDQYFARYHVSASYFLPAMAHWAHFGGHWWAIPAVSGPLGGQHIYLPRYMAPLGYNNRNLVTFDDYYRMSQKAVWFDKSRHLVRIGYWPGVDSWETIGTLKCPFGHGLYDARDQPTATDPCNVAYLSYLKKLVDLYGGYAKLQQFLAGDPDTDFLSGDPRAYMVTGKALISPSGLAYWNIPEFDSNSFGVKGGVSYQLTPLPITRHGILAEVATYPSTMQLIVIPPGAQHPDAAYAVSKMMCWDYNYLLGRSTSGSPVKKAQVQWLSALIAGEGALRKQAGLPGNPAAQMQGLQMQPRLGLLSKTSNPINPVDIYYREQLATATKRVLYGQESPQYALEEVQRLVLAEEQQLKAQYGNWHW